MKAIASALAITATAGALAATATPAAAESAVIEQRMKLERLLAEDKAAKRQATSAAQPNVFQRLFGGGVDFEPADTRRLDVNSYGRTQYPTGPLNR